MPYGTSISGVVAPGTSSSTFGMMVEAACGAVATPSFAETEVGFGEPPAEAPSVAVKSPSARAAVSPQRIDVRQPNLRRRPPNVSCTCIAITTQARGS